MDPSSLLSRELGARQSHASCHMSEGIARKLALETVLHGHDGCVNRLAWNEDGTMLASASDDCQIMLWHYPDTGRVPIALHTEHRANLFGVQFLPQHNNTRIISGAMDYTVQLHELESGAFNIKPRYRSSSSSRVAAAGGVRRQQQQQQHQVHRVVPRTTVYHCHKSRVKEVEVSPSEPTMFWSAGEDGIVRQYDTRVSDQKAYGSPNVLVDLTAAGARRVNSTTGSMTQQLVECKGVDVNHVQPHLMAVACGDPYVRVFDRRKLTPSRPGGSSSQPLLKLTCPHIPLLLKAGAAAGVNRRAHSTHVNFSNRGDRLVTSFHGDHAYIFDTTGAADGVPVALRHQQQQPSRSDLRSPRSPGPMLQISQISPDQDHQMRPGSSATLDQSAAADLAVAGNLPEAAEMSKVAGNNALFAQQYSAAVADFTAAIAAAPWVAGLYTQRALAYLKRGWEGDAAYALRDCEMALDLVAQSRGAAAAAAAEQQARLRQVHALKQLRQSQCALAALESYTRHYPQAADSNELSTLKTQLQKQVEQQQTYRTKLRLHQQRLHQRQQQQQQQTEQQRSAAAAAARERYRVRQRQQQEDPEQAAERELQQQQQQQQGTEGPPAGVDRAGSSSGGSSSSRETSPIGAPVLQEPPGPGIRVDTDLDSDGLEDLESPRSAAAATAGEMAAAAAAAPAGSADMDIDSSAAAAAVCDIDQGFIGPVIPAHLCRPAAAAAEAGPHQQQQLLHAGSSNGTSSQQAAAAAAAAVARGRAVSHRIGIAGGDAADSDQEVHSMNSEYLDSESDTELSRLDCENELSDDELLTPWYGPSAYAQQQMGIAIDQQQQQQQQQQNGSSSSRRRPRSSSDTGAAADSDQDPLNPTAASRQQRRSRARYTNGFSTQSSKLHGQSNKPNGQNNSCNNSWWDALSGGPGRLLQRCIGHCNVQTDIKEAVFLGDADELVACGSDDGCVFIYSASTGAAVRVLQADEDVANCVRCHPTLPVLATSGIDSVVKLWSPTAQADTSNPTTHVNANQSRMRDGPRLLRGAAIPPAALQAALDENPQLLQLLVQQLYGIGSGAAGTGAAAAANRGPAAAAEGGGDQGLGFEFEFGDEGSEGEGGSEGAGQQRRRRRAHGEVACRVS